MYGKELILDLKQCKNINEESLRAFVVGLCEEIDMERYGDCQIIYFGKGEFQGYSLMQFITTSSIVGHFTDTEAFINIFSCKEYCIAKTTEYVTKHFETKDYTWTALQR